MAGLSEGARRKLERIGWATIPGSVGIALLVIVDWRIALGVFLFVWADNISKG